jgi:phage-related minor tail protein
MTEDQIERKAERHMDQLDQQLLTGSITQEEYDEETREIEKWVQDELRMILSSHRD